MHIIQSSDISPIHCKFVKSSVCTHICLFMAINTCLEHSHGQCTCTLHAALTALQLTKPCCSLGLFSHVARMNNGVPARDALDCTKFIIYMSFF